MSEKSITFEDLPKAMSWMMDKLNELDSKIDGLNNQNSNVPTEQWMNLKELCEYIPSHPAEQTVYGWTSCHLIPFHKRGKRIMFLKSEIDVILIAALIGLYFFGKKAQKKQEEQQAQIEATKQTVSMLVIDKKRMPLKESGLPQMVIEQTPKLMRRSKLPIVKAKVGPRIAIMIADEKVFDLIPVKKEIKAEVSGLYIVGVKGIRGSLEAPATKKKGFFARFKKDKAAK